MRKLAYNTTHCLGIPVSNVKILINNHFDFYTMNGNDVGTIGRVLEGDKKE